MAPPTPAQQLANQYDTRRQLRAMRHIRREVDQLQRRIGAGQEIIAAAQEVVPPGSGPYLFDYILDPSYPGPNGFEYQTLHGHTFRAFNKIQAAYDDAAVRFPTSAANFGLAPGDYNEDVIFGTITGGNSAARREFYGFGGRGRRVAWGNTIGASALTLSESLPDPYMFHNIFFRGGSGSNSMVSSGDTNFKVFCHNCDFERPVSADFAGAGFLQSIFRNSGYGINAGHTPATVFFDDCEFSLTGVMPWIGGSQDHYFSHCLWTGTLAGFNITDGTNTALTLDTCTFANAGVKFRLNGATATLGGFSVLNTDFNIPGTVDGSIYFQNHNGCIRVIVVGNRWLKSNGVQHDYITSDVEVRSAIFLGNAFGSDGFGANIYNEQENPASSSIEGLFRNSTFGPNVPALVAQYGITGVENEFYPASSAIGPSVPSPLQFMASITRQQAHALAVR